MRGRKSTAFHAPISRNSLTCPFRTELNPNPTNVEKRQKLNYALKEASFSLSRFFFTRRLTILWTDVPPNHKEKYKNSGKVRFTPLSTARLSPNRFPRDIQLLNSNKWRSTTPNFTEIGQCIWKVRVRIHLRPQSTTVTGRFL